MVKRVVLEDGKYYFSGGFPVEIPARVAGEERWRRKIERVGIKGRK